MENKLKIETTSASLHIMAMAFMLCDHLWGTVLSGSDWLTCIGRLTFPIYAFLLVEGYFHTKNLKKYVGRLTLFAVLSEIPFNLAMGSTVFYPLHQNVLWSFLISIWLIHLNEKAKGKLWRQILVGIGTILLGYILGIVTFVDYYGCGILMVLVFYFFRQRKWWCFLGQFICLAYINLELLDGFAYELQLFGETFYFARQGFAMLALIPIWLYRGNQGPHNKAFQYFCYAFYPVHLLILGLIQMFM